jgi:hypothetical protein
MTGVLAVLMSTMLDILPILALVLFFQFVVLRQPIPQARRVVIGSLYVLSGLALFLIGLEKALFPLGRMMASQLSAPAFLGVADVADAHWWDYHWVYIFAAAIGYAMTIAEPSLIAVGMKAEAVSGGSLKSKELRVFVAIGVAIALVVGVFRIVTGTLLEYYMLGSYLFAFALTLYASKDLVALAGDSGGVTTSTVTVPIVTALGLGLTTSIPGRDPALDGFGLLALADPLPMSAVLLYGLYRKWKAPPARTPAP